MAHPKLTRTAAVAGTALTALLLPLGPASALSIPETTVEEVAPLPDCATEIIDGVCTATQSAVEAAEPVTAPATEAVAPATEAAAPVVEQAAPVVEQAAPVVEQAAPVVQDVPVVGEAAAEEAEAAPQQATGGSSSSDSTDSGESSSSSSDDSTTTTPLPSSDPSKVSAAGKAPTEVVEPQAPAADGRVTGNPTIQPANLGSNMAGVRSQNGLNLQPYDAPIVSVPPADVAAPEIAPPASTATPVQQAAADAIRFTGESMLPYTSGVGAWITATGLGLLGAAGYGLRRRADQLTAQSLEA